MSGSIIGAHAPYVARLKDIVLDHTGSIVLRNSDDKEQPVCGSGLQPQIDQFKQALLLMKS
jgi:hypothetical protein